MTNVPERATAAIRLDDGHLPAAQDLRFSGRAQERSRERPRFGVAWALLARNALLIALVLMALLFSLVAPQTFPTSGNFNAIVTSQAVVLILALALLFPMRSGDFDLSLAATMALAAALVGVLTGNVGVALWVALGAALCAGVVIGSLNALLIVYLEIDAFIVTLAMMTIVVGVSMFATNGQVSLLTEKANGIYSLANDTILGLPLAVYFGWVLVGLFWYVFQHTTYGRHLLCVGAAREASHLMGLHVRRVRATAFVIASVLAALGGILFVGLLGSVDPTAGASFLLPPYAAIFLGATAFQLGRFNVLGTVVGLYFLAIGVTGLQLVGLSLWVTNVFDGVGLIVAVMFGRLIRSRASHFETAA